MTHRTAQGAHEEARRQRLTYAFIAQLAAERRREMSKRHTHIAIAVLIVMTAVAYIFR